jgi:hypothetical protein
MNVLSLQVFVSLMLVLSAVVALVYSVRQGDHEHADRLSLLPLDDDDAPPAAPSRTAFPSIPAVPAAAAAPAALRPAPSPSQQTNPNKGD